MSKFSFISSLILLLFTFTRSGLTIIGPNELSNLVGNSALDMDFANFGTKLSGVFTRGELFLEKKTSAHNGCDDLSGLSLSRPEDTFGEKFPILLVKRGQCSFVYKARQAQKIGASMLLVINTDNNIHNVIMADDGTGSDIYIPVIMIKPSQGQIIEKYLSDHENVRVAVEINFEKQISDSVTVRFFFSSSEMRAYTLINNLTSYLNEFGNQVKFEPIYVTHQHPSYMDGETKRQMNCVSKGKYCYFPKETTITQNGQVILIEDIRQKCLFNSNNSLKRISNYFSYMKAFYDKCLNKCLNGL